MKILLSHTAYTSSWSLGGGGGAGGRSEDKSTKLLSYACIHMMHNATDIDTSYLRWFGLDSICSDKMKLFPLSYTNLDYQKVADLEDSYMLVELES